MEDKHKIRAASYAILRNNEGQVLFMRRTGTGYMDGKLGLPSGHVELNESFESAMKRELLEEAGVQPEDGSVNHTITLHRYQPSGRFDYIDTFFEVSSWQGVPRIMEPDKASEIVWSDPREVKNELVPYLEKVFSEISLGNRFIELERGEDE